MNLMRKHAKSWLIKFLIGIIAVVFIFYFGYSFRSGEEMKIAYVNGELISTLEYQKAYRNLLETLQKEYKNIWSDNLIQTFNLKNRALESVIGQRLVAQEAKRLGLDVTEEEIQKAILVYPAFQFRGQFDQSRYRTLLQQNRMKPEDFEASIGEELLQRKLGQFLMTFSIVTEREAHDYYSLYSKKVKIGFVEISPEPYKGSMTFDPPSLEKYFNDQREKYRIPEKIKIAYIVIDPETFRKDAKVSDEEIKNYYEDNKEMFKVEKQVKASHILLKVKDNATEEEEKEIRDKALSIAKRARQGEDFAQLAKTYSEGPAAEKGGDLGYFSKGQMIKPFEEAVFKMNQGEISDPVKTSFGYHVIKLEDIKEARVKPLEEVRESISETLTQMAAMDLSHSKALSLMDQIPYDVNLREHAEKHHVPVRETDYFSQDDSIPDMGGDEKLRQSLFSLQEKDVSELLEYNNKFYIIQIIGKMASRLPEFTEIGDKVKEDFILHLSLEKAKSVAEGYLGKLRQGEHWDQLARDYKLTPQTTDFFTRNDPIPTMGFDPAIREVVFSLGPQRPYPDKVFENEKGALVLRWEGEEGADEAAFEKDKEKIKNALMLAKHQVVFSEWLKHLRNKAEIEIVNPVDK